MALEKGEVNTKLETWTSIRAVNRASIQCLLDTGFNGSLMLDRRTANELGLSVLGKVPILTVGSGRIVTDVAEIEIEWLGRREWAEVIISDSDDHLVGTQLLRNAELLINYKTGKVTITD